MNPNRRQALLGMAAAPLVTSLGPSHAKANQPAGSHLPHAKPEEIGLNPGQLERAYELLEGWTAGAKPAIPGGAILVGRNGKVVPPKFFGKQGPEPNAEPIREDSLFLMASITKPVVYTAAMKLVEQGKLNLADRVVRYLPEFRGDGKTDVLVSQLFTHTSGLPDMLDDNEELRRKHVPMQTFLDKAVRETKLLFAPGTEVSYQSMGTAVVAEIVQQLSGMSIIDYLKKEVFSPLGLKSIGLGSDGFDRDRLVRVEVPAFQKDSDFGWNSDYWQKLGAPWGGLFSSPEDFAVICQMLLDQGRANGVRLLSPASVNKLTTNRLLEYPDLPENVARTQPWGLGWRLNHPGTPGSWSDLLGNKVFGHTGATGTMVWINPETKGFCLLLTSALRSRAPWRLVQLSNVIAAAFE